MAPQLQINQGPQDALLYDNTRSYFTPVGYARTSNFQVELRDVEPQNAATFGSTVQFIIPKAADLLGPVDLLVDFTPSSGQPYNNTASSAKNLADGQSLFIGWVESLGFAMIDKITMSVGANEIETISGDQLYIINELMRTNEQRLGKDTILKTGRPLIRAATTTSSWQPIFEIDKRAHNSSRLICAQHDDKDGTASDDVDTLIHYDGKKLIIPLGLFFTKHPSCYFPLPAIAGCNDIRISIKFRPINELIIITGSQPIASSKKNVDDAAPTDLTASTLVLPTIANCRLRCHYVHVTGPEASALMNKEHVRLLKLWHHYPTTAVIPSKSTPEMKRLFDFELPFLHPVQEIIIVIRKVSEMSSSMTANAKISSYDRKAREKNYFAFQGGDRNPNIENHLNCVHEGEASTAVDSYLKVDNFKLTLNGQERHASLASSGLDRDYLMNRLLPMLHSNTTTHFYDTADGSYNGMTFDGTAVVPAAPFTKDDLQALGEMIDRKEIYVYPFALNPEGANPSGAVNFSKVSHAKLTISGYAYASSSTDTNIEYRCDCWGVHYNWLQIKEGRALTSFA